jgi:hypothetical protein
MNGCWVLKNAFSASNEMFLWLFSLSFFFFFFFNVVDYVDGFPYIEPPLHPRDEVYLIMMDDFNVFLDLVCKNFIELFCINIHEGN